MSHAIKIGTTSSESDPPSTRPFTAIYTIPLSSSSAGVVHRTLDGAGLVSRPPTDKELGGVEERDLFTMGESGTEEGEYSVYKEAKVKRGKGKGGVGEEEDKVLFVARPGPDNDDGMVYVVDKIGKASGL
jgi:hypothetical protein